MKRFWKRPILRSPGRIKRWLYQRGYRPKPGTILYSPSLNMMSGFADAMKAKGWELKVTHERCTCPAGRIAPHGLHFTDCPLSANPHDSSWPHPHHRCPIHGQLNGYSLSAMYGVVCPICGSPVETDYKARLTCSLCLD